MLLNELFEVSQDLVSRYKTAAIKDADKAIAAKAAGTMGRGEYERKMTKRGRGTAAAQRRLTPQGTRLDLTPYGDAIQRDYDRYRTDEQGVAEAYQFKGPFPFDVDHMHGGRGINLPKAETKKYFTDKKQWQRAVDDINSSKYDDNSDYIGVTGRSTVEINGREWARWSDAQQKGYIELSSMSEQGVAEAIPYALSAANANAEYERTKTFVPRGYKGRVDTEVSGQQEYRSVMAALKKLAQEEGQHIETGLSGTKMSIFSKTMGEQALSDFVDMALDNFDQGVAEGDAPVDHDWYRKQQERQTRAKQKQQGMAEGRTK
jgi:hypothetical protein